MAKETTAAAAYAKGGRFSKSNVRRNNAAGSSAGASRSDRDANKQPEGNNAILIAIVIVLLFAIVAVAGYIGYSLITSDWGADISGSQQQVGPSVPDPEKEIPCTGITLNVLTKEFTSESEQLLLSVNKTPSNTTDEVTYVSSDPDVAVVTSTGIVTPGTKQGEAVITVTCGNASAQCTIISTVGEPPVTEPTTPPGPVLPSGFVLKLKTYKDSGEITIAGDATANLYSETMGIKASDITWMTSDPTIATVENGKVTGIGKGTCTITATIGDQTATCKVICTSNAAPPSDYKISHVDVTISVGETFNLSLKNKDTGANVQGIVWQATQSGIVSINGNKITGQAVSWSGIEVFVEYEGVRYACRIIVKPAA